MRRHLELFILPLLLIFYGAVADASADYMLHRYSPDHPADWFWSVAFQAEYTQSVKRWHLSDDLLYWTADDYHGQYINFENGYRRTVGQPDDYHSTLWLVGNSTLVSQQVPDGETIASQLQTFLPAVRVVNVGMGGAYAVHEVNRIRVLPIAPGDSVVMIDGQLDAEAQNVDGYRRDVVQANRLVTARGAAFYHVLQPQLCTVQETEWERWLGKQFHDICRVYAAVWPQMQATEAGLDLTRLLDGARRSGTVFFFDAHHSNAAGNAIIARALYDYLYPVL